MSQWKILSATPEVPNPGFVSGLAVIKLTLQTWMTYFHDRIRMAHLVEPGSKITHSKVAKRLQIFWE